MQPYRNAGIDDDNDGTGTMQDLMQRQQQLQMSNQMMRSMSGGTVNDSSGQLPSGGRHGGGQISVGQRQRSITNDMADCCRSGTRQRIAAAADEAEAAAKQVEQPATQATPLVDRRGSETGVTGSKQSTATALWLFALGRLGLDTGDDRAVFEALLAKVREVGASMSGLELLEVGLGASDALMPTASEDVARFAAVYSACV